MQNQVIEEDRLRCFVDSKYSPQRTIRHLELKRTQKHMLDPGVWIWLVV